VYSGRILLSALTPVAGPNLNLDLADVGRGIELRGALGGLCRVGGYGHLQHHDGYTTWADFLANEARLAANRTRHGVPCARAGPAVFPLASRLSSTGSATGPLVLFARFTGTTRLSDPAGTVHTTITERPRVEWPVLIKSRASSRHVADACHAERPTRMLRLRPCSTRRPRP
jgi:hypothetical protein